MWTITDPVKVDQTLFVSTCHVYPHFCRVLGYLSRCARYPLALGANLHSFSVPTGALWHPRPMHAHPTVSSMWVSLETKHTRKGPWPWKNHKIIWNTWFCPHYFSSPVKKTGPCGIIFPVWQHLLVAFFCQIACLWVSNMTHVEVCNTVNMSHVPSHHSRGFPTGTTFCCEQKCRSGTFNYWPVTTPSDFSCIGHDQWR